MKPVTRRAHIVYKREPGSKDFAEKVFNSWIPKVAQPLDDSVEALRKVATKTGIIRLQNDSMKLIHTEDELHSLHHHPISAIKRLTPHLTSDHHREYRIFGSINLDFTGARNTNCQTSKNSNPELLVAISTESTGVVGYSPAQEAVALHLRVPYSVDEFCTVLHDLALDFFCCIEFMEPFLRNSSKRRLEQIKSVGEHKLRFFRQRGLNVYGTSFQHENMGYYIPFTTACRAIADAGIDYEQLLMLWKDFRDFYLSETTDNANIVRVTTAAEVLTTLQGSKIFRSTFGLLPRTRVAASVTGTLQRCGAGDYAFIVAQHRPSERANRLDVARQFRAGSRRWRNYLWKFEPYSEHGYEAYKPYTHIQRFRYFPEAKD